MTRNPFDGWFRVVLGRSLSEKDTNDAVEYAQRRLDARQGAEFRAGREGRKPVEDIDPQVIERARVLMERHVRTMSQPR